MNQQQDSFARAVTSPTLLSVYEIWNTLAAGRIGPRRSELTPVQLRRAMPFTFTVEVIEDGKDFRFGFAGDRVMQFLDRRCAAPTLAALTGTRFFAGADRLFRQCAESGKPLISGPKPTTYSGKEYLEREVLLLPLSEDGVRVTGILGRVRDLAAGHPSARDGAGAGGVKITVMPAEAGIQRTETPRRLPWIPACAGMTII